MNIFRSALLVLLMAGCSEKRAVVIEDSNPVVVQAKNSLWRVSSRILDELVDGGREMGTDSFNIAECGSNSDGVTKWEVTHFWQIEKVPAVDIPQIMIRLRGSLVLQNWLIADVAFPPAVKNPVVRAQDSQGYTVRVLGVQDRSRIAVRISAPCFTAPEADS